MIKEKTFIYAFTEETRKKMSESHKEIWKKRKNLCQLSL